MRVLISHAVEDEPAAAALKELIRRCSLQKVDVWFSSDNSALGGMPIGGPWFSELYNKLKTADWIVALVTAQSISSPWLHFEVVFVRAAVQIMLFQLRLDYRHPAYRCRLRLIKFTI
jgi:TIR domain